MNEMKGEMELEYPFKVFLYVVVILVVVSLVITFKQQIASTINFCQHLPQFCQEDSECSTVQVKREVISEAVIREYCNSCWDKTGKKEYGESCMCYIVAGEYSTVNFESENCELRCSKSSGFLSFTYDKYFKEVFIDC